MRNDMQLVRDAIEAAGLLNSGGSGPMYNDARKDGTRRIKLAEAGYFPDMPLHIQRLIKDYLDLFFGERLVSTYFVKNVWPRNAYWGEQPQHDKCALCVVLKD